MDLEWPWITKRSSIRKCTGCWYKSSYILTNVKFLSCWGQDQNFIWCLRPFRKINGGNISRGRNESRPKTHPEINSFFTIPVPHQINIRQPPGRWNHEVRAPFRTGARTPEIRSSPVGGLAIMFLRRGRISMQIKMIGIGTGRTSEQLFSRSPVREGDKSKLLPKLPSLRIRLRLMRLTQGGCSCRRMMKLSMNTNF